MKKPQTNWFPTIIYSCIVAYTIYINDYYTGRNQNYVKMVGEYEDMGIHYRDLTHDFIQVVGQNRIYGLIVLEQQREALLLMNPNRTQADWNNINNLHKHVVNLVDSLKHY